MDRVDTTVIGAGVVGIAVARALALSGHSVLIIDREARFGEHTSSRNSEVIHAGIYYPKGSLKAQLCVEGKWRLYKYCEDRGVPHLRCGKLIVATNDTELAELDKIWRAAAANGVNDLSVLSATEARALEPELACTGALLSPSTGVIDSHAFTAAILGEAEAHGAQLVLNTEFESAVVGADGMVIRTAGPDAFEFETRLLVNSAGLWAPAVADKIEGLAQQFVPKAYFAKGNYFSASGRQPFSRLVYPVPEPGGLGVHYTRDLSGSGRFGPDVEWIDDVSYSVDPARAQKFYAAIRRYWPGLRDGALEPSYCGVRPKISGPGEASADFCISGPEDHGVPGLVNLFGIESPGLTSSLALADRVVAAASPL